MSTIRRIFFPGALPGGPAATAGISADDARPICSECIASAQCVFAEHLNKGIFFAKHLRIARSIVSHRRAMKTRKWLARRRFGIHEPPTIGCLIRHRTSRFAQKLRKLFPGRDRHRGWPQSVDGDVDIVFRGCVRARFCTASNQRQPVDRNIADRNPAARRRRGWRVCMSPRRDEPIAQTTMPARGNPAGIVWCCCRSGTAPAAKLSGLRLPAVRRSRPGPAVR